MTDQIINQLNNRFKDSVSFYQILEQKPVLIDHGEYEAEKKVVNKASKIRSTLRTDEPHVVLIEPIDFSADPVIFHYKKLPYSQVVAIREQGDKPPLLTANIIAVDTDVQQIVLQHRSSQSHVYPNKLSIPGGGFQPSRNNYVSPNSEHDNDTDIAFTAQREFYEETMLSAKITPNTKMLLTQEKSTGAVQVNFLGAITEIKKTRDTDWEGNVLHIHFNQLYEILTTKEWVPLGKSCVLAWLALGTPGAENCKFGDLTAYAVYKKYIEENVPKKISD